MNEKELIKKLEQKNEELQKAVEANRNANEKLHIANIKLKREKDNYYNLFEKTPNCVAVYRPTNDGNDFIFVAFNKAAEKVDKIPKETVLGNKVTEMFPEVEKFGLLDVFKKVNETGKSMDHPISFYKDYKVEGWRQNHVYKLPTGEIVAIYKDITKQKQQEEKLKKSEDKYCALFKNTGTAMCIVEENKIISLVNPEFEKLSGYSKKEIENKIKFTKLVAKEDISRLEKNHEERRKYNNKSPKTFEFHFKDKSNNIRWIHLTVDLIQGTKQSVASLIDITESKHAKEKLLEANKIINRSSAVAFLWKNEDGWPVEFVSDNVEKLFGYSVLEFIESKVLYSEIVHKDDIKRVAEEVMSYSNKNGVQTFTHKPYRIITKNNDIKWIDDITYIRRNSRGIITHYEGIVYEITNRIKTEENLKESEERFRTLYENSTIGLYRTTPSGEIILSNPALVNMLGYSSFEDIKSRNINKEGYFEPYGRKEFLNLINKEGILKAYEAIWLKKDGTKIFIRESATIIKDNNGKILYYEGTVEDITEQKQAEEELYNSNKDLIALNEEYLCVLDETKSQNKELKEAKFKLEESEARFKNIAELLPQTVFETDIEGNVTFLNQQSYEMFGYTKEEFEGKTINFIDYIAKQDKERALNDVKNRLSKKDADIYEYLAVKKNGNTFPVNIYSDIIYKKNKPVGVRGILVDHTHIKQQEQELIIAKEKAQESDKLKSSFLANMSHEIRTPMNGIIGFSELLGDTDLPQDERKEYIDIINKSCYKLISIINDIIDISKIEAGVIEINNINTNVNQVLAELDMFFKPQAAEKKITLHHKNNLSDKQCTIYTDEVKLNQILTNLINNAIKFTDKGKVEFGCVLKNNFIEFYINDTGIGLSKKQKEIIFQPFRQVETIATNNMGGTGLGLFISKAFINKMGGKIWLDTKPKQGATFYFTIPYKPVEIKKKTAYRKNEKLEKVNWKNKTILIAEDEETNYKYLKEVLSVTNAKLIHATTGVEAVEYCKTNKNIDIVIMDMKMPVMDGYDATIAIKKIKSNLPIIAQTAFALSYDKQKTIEAGCDDYMAKPINSRMLFEKISSFID